MCGGPPKRRERGSIERRNIAGESFNRQQFPIPLRLEHCGYKSLESTSRDADPDAGTDPNIRAFGNDVRESVIDGERRDIWDNLARPQGVQDCALIVMTASQISAAT